MTSPVTTGGKKCAEQDAIDQRTVVPDFNLPCSLNAPWFRSSLCSRVRRDDTRFLKVDQKKGSSQDMQRRRNAPGANRGAPRLRQPRMGPPQDEAGAAARAEARAEAACAAAAAVEATQPTLTHKGSSSTRERFALYLFSNTALKPINCYAPVRILAAAPNPHVIQAHLRCSCRAVERCNSARAA